jgi:NAD(P)-dependent dehydrogenase (short-subunit alcohol dehydrogenase family)
MMSQTPQGKRLAEPEEIAYAVGMLCEEKARFINGIHVHVSGGLYID